MQQTEFNWLIDLMCGRNSARVKGDWGDERQPWNTNKLE